MYAVEYTDKQLEVYGPLVSGFRYETKEDWRRLWFEPRNPEHYLSGLMVPKVFPNYQKCKKRIVFLGQDTYDWVSLDFVYSEDASHYLDRNNNAWPKKIEDIIQNSSNPYHFWNYVCKIQLAIQGSKAELSALTEDDKAILSGIGWGNLNPLEKDSTIWKYGSDFCKQFDWDVYYHLFEKAREISKAKYLIEAYHPDVIINLCWDYDENFFFEGTNARFIKEKNLENTLACYEIQESNTQVIWSRHPNNLKFCSISPDEMIKLIVDRIE